MMKGYDKCSRMCTKRCVMDITFPSLTLSKQCVHNRSKQKRLQKWQSRTTIILELFPNLRHHRIWICTVIQQIWSRLQPRPFSFFLFLFSHFTRGQSVCVASIVSSLLFADSSSPKPATPKFENHTLKWHA